MKRRVAWGCVGSLIALSSACAIGRGGSPDSDRASLGSLPGEEREAASNGSSKAASSNTAREAGQESTAPELPGVPESEGWRRAPPKGSGERAPTLPSFRSARLKNGLTILVAEDKAMLPLVSFELVTKGGAATDPQERAGLAAVTYGMLGEGAATRDALQFSDALADLGATFGAAADRDRGSVSVGGLVRNADAMLGLLADAVLRPRLAEKDFLRRKEQTIAALKRQRGSPQGLAFEALPALVYGPAHPYGHPPTGTVETVSSISLDEVRRAKPRILSPQHSALIAAGDITLEEATRLAEKHFGRWVQPAPKLGGVPSVPESPRSDVVLIHKPNSPQTMVLIGKPIFGRGHPDEAPMTVLNEIYGGAFSSRLNMNLREDKGFTYGASSQAAYRTGVGVFVAYSAIRQDATAPGVSEFFHELENLSKTPPTDEEVALAKAGIIRALPGSFERTQAIASAASAVFVYALPLDYYTHLARKYGGVTVEEVRKAASRYLRPETMRVLLVGDSGVIGEPVGHLDLGRLVIRETP